MQLAGRGWPKSLSHASDPIPITQERFPSYRGNRRHVPAREVAEKRADCRSARGARVDRDDQKDRGAGQILDHRLGYGRHLRMARRARSLDLLHSSCPVKGY